MNLDVIGNTAGIRGDLALQIPLLLRSIKVFYIIVAVEGAAHQDAAISIKSGYDGPSSREVSRVHESFGFSRCQIYACDTLWRGVVGVCAGWACENTAELKVSQRDVFSNVHSLESVEALTRRQRFARQLQQELVRIWRYQEK